MPDGMAVNTRMREVTSEDYYNFILSNREVRIADLRVELVRAWNIASFQPSSFEVEGSTVWSFPDRGNWATHIGNYRGNWSPLIPRNLIAKYTRPGDLICDSMVGSGTTLVECKLLGRHAVGVDINPNAAMIAMNRLDFEYVQVDNRRINPKIKVFVGDARRLDSVGTGTIDLVATHPPYAGIVPYSNADIPGDLSALRLDEFTVEIGKVASECFRILKNGRYCAILIGDTRKHRHYIPIHIGVLGKFLDAGFILKEDIIKLQHETMSSRGRWNAPSYDFYKIAHEHLFVFRKPDKDDKLFDYRNSMHWW